MNENKACILCKRKADGVCQYCEDCRLEMEIRELEKQFEM